MTPTGRGVVLACRYFALIGVALSFVGLVLAVGIRIEGVLRRGGLLTASGALEVMDAFKEAGVTFLLACILLVLCELALAKSPKEVESDAS